MKQVFQLVDRGDVQVLDVPSPMALPGTVLVRTQASVVSVGTERIVSEFAGKSLLGKARARPDLVRQVLAKARQEGVAGTFTAVRTRLGQPMPLGYCSAGVVIGVGDGVTDVRPGDRVACCGGGYAVHAEIVAVPRNLVAAIVGEHVTLEEAAFTTLGAIALHGVRLAEAQVAETVAVIGLGVLGQLAVQVLKAAGCLVAAIDLEPSRAERARRFGADAVATGEAAFVSAVHHLSEGRGADSVLITAASESNGPVELAGRIARDRGRVIAVGAVGLHIPRKVFYEKELDFRVSRSYGPGRYDSDYEEGGHDYPAGYVRWTENRNMAAVLQLIAAGKIQVAPLITHRFPVDDAPAAYRLIAAGGEEPFLGVVLTYGEAPDVGHRLELAAAARRARDSGARGGGDLRVGVLGAGNFALATLLPAMRNVSGIELVGVCSARGASGRHAADKFGFRFCTTDESQLLGEPSIDTVVVATRHGDHARQVVAALEAGKHVFCEKPLCLDEPELRAIVSAQQRAGRLLAVGFNRRFSPMARLLKRFVEPIREPLVMSYRVNAGYIPPDHWVHDPKQGGGRILGEVCHFVDFLTFVCGAWPTSVHAVATPNGGRYCDDNVVVALTFANGSVGTIVYAAGGDRSVPKERMEVLGGGATAILDDFRRLRLVRNGRRKVSRSWVRQDKGHRAQWQAFVGAVRDHGRAPIAFEEIVAVTLATLGAVHSLRAGEPVRVDLPAFVAGQGNPHDV